MPRASTHALLLFACSCGHAARVEAQPIDPRLASLEEVMQMDPSASRFEQPAEDVPAAIYRRRGAVQLPWQF
jgi:hypothetical protein